MEFSKQLSRSEAKYKYIGLPKKIREEFPERDQIFKLKFKNKIFDMKVNNKNCIMLTQLYNVYQFQENDEVKIIIGNNSFVFKVNE
ncbi:hypothetical protein C4565_07985 [Candidatus Parcubacteria bacterium]|nr:MAG: hypothetical protein C4565_07985 [Candidatus Parcubacteria bacterium]